MTEFNIFTDNLYSNWKVNERDIIDKTRSLLEFYISDIGSNSCLNNKKYSSITLDIVFCDSK